MSGFGENIPDYAPLSPETTISTQSPKSGISIHSLSFIMHPSHEATSDTQRVDSRENPPEENGDAPLNNEPVLIVRACDTLNISLDTLYRLCVAPQV
jgi:hypothetical protein